MNNEKLSEKKIEPSQQNKPLFLTEFFLLLPNIVCTIHNK